MSDVRHFKPLLATQLVADLVERGYLPTGTTRFVIDSGPPGGVVRIFWSGFADQDMLAMLIDGIEPLPEDQDIHVKGTEGESCQ
jgi:hypothetical protein